MTGSGIHAGELSTYVSMLPAGEPADPATAREMIRAFGGITDSPVRASLRITDRHVPGPVDAPAVAVRIYDPGQSDERRPVVIVLHGGGFIAGDLDTEDARCVRFAAEAACVVVNVDYRLSPEWPFPAALDDCDAVVQWVMASADELGVDPERVGLAGVSAGGTLAAALALRLRDGDGPRLAFQLLVNPSLDDRMVTASSAFMGTPLIDRRALESVWRHYLGADRDPTTTSPYAAPARAADVSGLPPTYILTSEHDPLRDEGLEFAARLLHAGVSVEVRNVAGAFHGFDTLPTGISRHAVDEQVTWLRWVTQA